MGKNGRSVLQGLDEVMGQERNAHPDAGVGCCWQDHHLVQDEAWRSYDDNPHHWFQRGGHGIQESHVYRLAHWWPAENPQTLEALLSNTNGLIFVVDSTDRDRIEEASEELFNVLEAEELRHAKVLVFANKQDLTNAMTTKELSEKLKLHELRGRQWFV